MLKLLKYEFRKGLTGLLVLLGVTAALEGYFLKSMRWYERIVSAIGGLLLIYPGWVTDCIGLALVAAVLAVQIVGKKRTALPVG